MLSANPVVDIDAATCRHSRTGECMLLTATSLLGLILVLLMRVFAQEAYYGTYAQHPGLWYFDHPLTLALGVSVVACGLACAWVVRFVPQTAGSSWVGWDENASRAEHWEERIDLEDGEEGNLFFFAGDHRDTSMRRQLLGDVEQRFAKVERVETVAVERVGRRVMDADIFVCRHYPGPEPSMHR